MTDLSSYLKLASRHELLSAEEERRLGRLIQDARAAAARLAMEGRSRADRRIVEVGRQARMQLVESNLRLVVKLARAYPTHTLVDLSDLIQAGNHGLLIAAGKFDPERGFRFSTYATTWIRSRMSRAIDEGTSALKMPADSVNALRTALRRTADGHTTLTEEHRRLQWAYDAASLDEPFEDGNHDLGDYMSCDGPDVDALVVERLERQSLHRQMRALPSRHRRALLLRFGYLNGEPRTLKDIGSALEISAVEARHLVNDGLQLLQDQLQRRRSTCP